MCLTPDMRGRHQESNPGPSDYKATPYVVSLITILICVGVFVFGGFRWEDRGIGWGYTFAVCYVVWAFITAIAFGKLRDL